MSETKLQVIKDVIKMTPKLSMDCLNSIRILMEKALDLELLRLEPKIELENMDITEKVMYLEYITEGQQEKIEQLEQSIDLAEIIEKEGLTLDELSDKN